MDKDSSGLPEGLSEDELRHIIMHSVMVINGGHGKGGYSIGAEPAVDYLTEMAMDGDDNAFVESASSLVMYLTLVDTPQVAVALLMNTLYEYMTVNSVTKAHADELMTSTHLKLRQIMGLRPVPTSKNGFLLMDGRVVAGDVFMGLQGVQFIEDVSFMTQELIDAVDELDELDEQNGGNALLN